MAVVTFSGVEVCSQAFVLLADNEISDFEDENDRARLAKRLYPNARQFLMGSYPWQFRKVQGVQLSRETETPVTRWKYQYILPADRLTDDMRAVYDSASEGANPLIDGFAIQDGKLYTDCEVIYVDYVNDGDESTWPPYFVTLAVNYMASLFALPVTDQQSTKNHYDTEVWGDQRKPGFMALARNADAQAGEVEVIQDAPFITARWGGSF